MAKQVFKVEGLKELDDALLGLAEEFSVRNARNVLRGALKDGGQIIADRGEANAPVLSGGLAESYVSGGNLSGRQRKMHRKESQLEVFVGPTSHPKSVQTEFGNAHQAAHPHLRPAWDAGWRDVLNLIVKRTSERLEATRKRLVKKAQREAAKLRANV